MSMRFSERIGKKAVKNQLQKDVIDSDLRNGLWNVCTLFIFDHAGFYLRDDRFRALYRSLWHNFFKRPLDTLPNHVSAAINQIRNWFFVAEWYEIYDFIEFVAQSGNNSTLPTEQFQAHCNRIMEKELSAYRFVGDVIASITNDNELKEIEEALVQCQKSKLQGANEHLDSAIEKLADRKSPDYRNSIKESISAVEAICEIISDEPGATLGKALKVLEAKINLHPALKEGFNKIYGYTSDADGIRHAMTETSNCDFEDAKYMLVSCSAFINYLIGKAAKAGIKLD